MYLFIWWDIILEYPSCCANPNSAISPRTHFLSSVNHNTTLQSCLVCVEKNFYLYTSPWLQIEEGMGLSVWGCLCQTQSVDWLSVLCIYTYLNLIILLLLKRNFNNEKKSNYVLSYLTDSPATFTVAIASLLQHVLHANQWPVRWWLSFPFALRLLYTCIL